jgi:hypothetical protein
MTHGLVARIAMDTLYLRAQFRPVMIYAVAPTDYTPKLHLDSVTGTFSIEGKTYTEDAHAFYGPVLDWFERNYLPSPAVHTSVEVKLEYYNTSNILAVFSMLRKLEPLVRKGLNVTVKWYYNDLDTDVEETGMDLQAVSELKVELIPYKE